MYPSDTWNFSLNGSDFANDSIRIHNVRTMQEWTSGTRFSLFVLLSVLITNGSVLNLFFQNRALLTPFTVYVLNLLFTNLLRTVLCYPLEIVNAVYKTWWTGWASCTLSLYGTWIVEAAMCNSHMLIALNRIWAITFPHSYRTKHTTPFATLICVTMWVYVHVGLLPGLVMDAAWYRKPVGSDGCVLNSAAQMTWSYIIQALFYLAPYAVVVMAYPVVCFKLWRTSHTQVKPAPSSIQRSEVMEGVAERSSRLTSKARINVGRTRKQERTSAFFVLTLMTWSFFLCYGPSQVYYSALTYSDWDMPGLFQVQSALYELMAILDPVLYTLAVGDLRRAFWKTYVSPCSEAKKR